MDPNAALGDIRASDDPDLVAARAHDLDEWITSGGFLPKEWEVNCNGGLVKRALLAVRVHEEAGEKFYSGRILGDGPFQAAYLRLVGAILKGEKYVLPDYPPSVKEGILAHIDARHPARAYVVLEEDMKREKQEEELLERANLAKEVCETWMAGPPLKHEERLACQEVMVLLLRNILRGANEVVNIHAEYAAHAGPVFRRTFPAGHGVWAYIEFRDG